MAASIGPYAPVFLPGEPPLPDTHAWQARAYRVANRHYWSNPARMNTRLKNFFFFCCGSSIPVRAESEGGRLLGLQGPWWRQVCRDMDCLCHRSYGPIRVFFQASWSWWSEGLFGQSFSIAPPIQALRGLPCLGSFSVVWHIKHTEGPPSLASYSLDLHVRHLKGYPGWGPTL